MTPRRIACAGVAVIVLLGVTVDRRLLLIAGWIATFVLIDRVDRSGGTWPALFVQFSITLAILTMLIAALALIHTHFAGG